MSMINANSVSTPAPRMSMENVEKSWSQLYERTGRDEGGGGKATVRSMNGNTRALRGGDWVSSGFSNGTLAVTWTHGKHEKKYGLTVAHIFTDFKRGVGSSVYAYDSDEPLMTKLDGTKAHKPIKIGTVVSIDMQTDSAIFEIFDHIKIDALAVALSGGDDHIYRITLPTVGESITLPPEIGERLMMFGAARRGMIGCRVLVETGPANASSQFAVESSYETSGEGQVKIDGLTKHSFSGHCGALYFDQDGNPVAMNTAIWGLPKTYPTCWTSRGSFLDDIVNNAHPSFFSHNQGGDALDSSLHRNQSSPSHQHGLAVSLEKIVCLTTENQYPSLYFPEDSDSDNFVEYRSLPMSRLPLMLSEDDLLDGSAQSNVYEEEKNIEQ